MVVWEKIEILLRLCAENESLLTIHNWAAPRDLTAVMFHMDQSNGAPASVFHRESSRRSFQLTANANTDIRASSGDVLHNP